MLPSGSRKLLRELDSQPGQENLRAQNANGSTSGDLAVPHRAQVKSLFELSVAKLYLVI